MNPATVSSPIPIDPISGGFRASQILFTANRLGVFVALGDDARSVEELAQALDATPRGMRILCDALVCLELLVKENGRYRNSPIALDYLLPDAAKSQVAMVHHHAKLYETWGKLYDVIKTGKKVSDETIDPRLLGDERSFAKAMGDIARISAKQLVELLDISGIRNMLDLGGGPGNYAIEFALANPNLRATVFDTPQTLEVARANSEEANVAERVALLPGDMLRDEFGQGYDFILFSNVAHIFSGETNRLIVEKCARALVPGGRLCIKEFFVDPDRTSPAWGALFAVNMLVGTEGGDCYTLDEAREWMENAGLAFDSVIVQTPQSSLLIGKK